MDDTATAENLTDLTADIVSAYVGKNNVRAEDLPGLISTVHGALTGLTAPRQSAPEKREPAAPVKSSIRPDYLVSLIDGKRYKALKRHLRTHGMTPEQYREEFNLRPDYPMVAPNYSKARSEMAKKFGLGTKGPAARKARKRAAKKSA